MVKVVVPYVEVTFDNFGSEIEMVVHFQQMDEEIVAFVIVVKGDSFHEVPFVEEEVVVPYLDLELLIQDEVQHQDCVHHQKEPLDLEQFS